jgi:hypothetical protein
MKLCNFVSKRLFQTKYLKSRSSNLHQTMFRNYTSDFELPPKKSTTILAVRKGNEVVMIGDGQVSQGSIIVKGNVNKLRVLHFSPDNEGTKSDLTDGK